MGLTTGFGCMHREITGGCFFCLPETFTDEGESNSNNICWEESVSKQIDLTVAKIRKGTGISGKERGSFLGYYQVGFTALLGLDELNKIYDTTLRHKEIAGLIVSARPDEIDDETMMLLKRLQGDVYLELGMQTVNRKGLEFLGRNQQSSDMDNALQFCKKYGFSVGVHLIIGIPGESISDIMATIDYVNNRREIKEVKLHNLVVYKGTELSRCPQKMLNSIPCLEDYIELLGIVIAHLRQDIVISRFFTSNIKGNNIALNPFSGVKRDWLNRLTEYLNEKNIVQGMNYPIPGK